MGHSLKYWLMEGRKYQVLSRVPILSYKRTKYGNKQILDIEDGVKSLITGLENNSPFLAGRFGTTECNTVVRYLQIQKGYQTSYGPYLNSIANNCGFFPEEEKMLDKYCETVLDLWRELDLLCIMNCRGEGYIIQEYCKNAELTRLGVIDPMVTGWTKALKGKQVVVIHPFAETIESQYKNRREEIFPGTDILPVFELSTVKAIQTIAGEKDDRFGTWFDALDYMTEEALKKPFEIALIGCGAFGLPLGARLKREGKKVVHMGGCLQLLFGIRGARWDALPEYATQFNDAWVRPDRSDVPSNASKVEGGCYW